LAENALEKPNDHISSHDNDSILKNIECHHVYEEDELVVYIPVPKHGKSRDLSLTPIYIMAINTIIGYYQITQAIKGAVWSWINQYYD
jgi:hypothetical protein